MKPVITSEAISTGGRSGSVETKDGLFKTQLGNPLEKGIERRGPNPESLFASAYAACYHSALLNAAKKLGTELHESKLRAVVNLNEDTTGGYHLSVDLHGQCQASIAAKRSKSWKKRTKPAPIPAPCGATHR